jgi:drug/metabolite transporter (DMT)-like permease
MDSSSTRSGPARRFWNAAWPLLALSALMWAGNSVVGRAARDDVPPMALAFWRWVAAALVLAPFAWPQLKRDRSALMKAWKPLLGLALFGLGGFSALLYAGLQTTTALNGVLLQAATPPLIFLCSFLLFRERASPAQLAGVAVSLLGVAVIVGQGDLAGLARLDLNGGDALVLVAVVFYALYSSLLRLRPDVHPLSFAFALFAISAVLAAPLYLGELASGRGIDPTPGAWAAIVYVVLFPSLTAYLFYNRGVELIGAGRAGQSIHLMPVFGAVLATAFLGESFRPFHAVGVGLIAVGIGLASLRRRATLPA